MPASDPLEILLAHDRWGTGQVLTACAALTDEQFHRRFDMGPGSLHDTITHMLGAIRGWTDVLAGREARPRPEGSRRTIAELRAMADETYADFIATARSHPTAETVTRVRDGKSYTFTRGAVVTHVTTHGMHHRAQCLNMLRQVGAPQPQSSVTQWTLSDDSPR